jgi:hypothetical protein
MKNPGIFLYSRWRSAVSYAEGLSDAFRLSAEKLAEQQAERDALFNRSVKNALAMPLVHPCQGQAMPCHAVGDFIDIRRKEKEAYGAGVRKGMSIKTYLAMV